MSTRIIKKLSESISPKILLLFLFEFFNYHQQQRGIYLKNNQELVGVIKKILDKNHIVFSFDKTIILPNETVKLLQNQIGNRVSIFRFEDSYFLNYDEKK